MEIEHDAVTSRRYKEDLDGVWPQMEALEEENARFRVALNQIAERNDSNSPCKWMVDLARKALT